MGRGQVQGSQARTSRIQGRVYAMVLEAEHADQPDVQGMFLLLYVLIGALFHYYCIVCDRFGLGG